MFRHLPAAALLIVSLAACQAGDADDAGNSATPEAAARSAAIAAGSTPTPGAAEAGPAPAEPETADSDCGADKVGRWLNALPTGDVMQEIASAAGKRTYRYYKQGDPITMDFSSARLNVEVGDDGRIKRFWCG